MAVPRVLRIFKVREEGNLEFWVSNAVIVFSTILGVYLAAQAGYRTALDFEQVRSQREGYFMRQALLDEFRDNLAQADNLADFIVNRNGWRNPGGPDNYRLQDYVWETMKEHSITFQLPSGVLTGIRRYYTTAEDLARAMSVGQGTSIEAAKTLTNETKKARETVLPLLENDIAALRQRLIVAGFEPD